MPLSILESEESLVPYRKEIAGIFNTLKDVFESGGRLFLCGNGGSFADSIHIVGELVKSFERKRPLSDAMKERFDGLYGGDILAEQLEWGLPAWALGTNLSLLTALLNDCEDKEISFAQELFVLGREGDALIGISTSGNARNVLLAVSAAKALKIKTIGLTGKDGGKLNAAADQALVIQEKTTREVQQVHQVMYHTLCRMLEEYFYGS
jgi:D-sedoheptulose 7-phosphate isomerase